jgi:hypothetical protein
MRADLFPRSCATQGFIIFWCDSNQKKSYGDQHPIDQFLLITIEVYGCLHKKTNVFLHNCVNSIWSLKKLEDLIFLSWLFLFIKKIQFIAKDVSIFLNRKLDDNCKSKYILISFTSRHTSQHHNRLVTSNFWHRQIQSTCYRRLNFDMERFWHLIWAT